MAIFTAATQLEARWLLALKGDSAARGFIGRVREDLLGRLTRADDIAEIKQCQGMVRLLDDLLASADEAGGMLRKLEQQPR